MTALLLNDGRQLVNMYMLRTVNCCDVSLEFSCLKEKMLVQAKHMLAV